MKSLWISLFVLLTSCGYHLQNDERISVSVPYVVNDFEGELTAALIRAVSQTAQFRYATGEGDWILHAKVLRESQDRIGYRYNRSSNGEERDDRLIGTENRKEVIVEVRVTSSATGREVIGPQTFKTAIEFDYSNPDTISDIAFTNPTDGTLTPIISFSLGQLDTVGAAGEDSTLPLYQRIARKIVNGMLATGGH